MRCGVRCLDEGFSRVSGQSLQGGDIVVIQTHGRKGQYTPHLHVIASRGGWDAAAQQWRHLDSVPEALWRKKGQWHLLTRLRQTVQTPQRRRLVETGSTRYRAGFVTNVPKGDVPARYQRLATSLAKEVVSPPSALRRIAR